MPRFDEPTRDRPPSDYGGGWGGAGTYDEPSVNWWDYSPRVPGDPRVTVVPGDPTRVWNEPERGGVVPSGQRHPGLSPAMSGAVAAFRPTAGAGGQRPLIQEGRFKGLGGGGGVSFYKQLQMAEEAARVAEEERKFEKEKWEEMLKLLKRRASRPAWGI